MNSNLTRDTRSWTPEETAKLRLQSGRCRVSDIAVMLNRSERSVKAKAYTMNLKLRARECYTPKSWTEAEDAVLREMAGRATSSEIAVRLGSRSESAVRGEAKRLGISLAPSRTKKVVPLHLKPAFTAFCKGLAMGLEPRVNWMQALREGEVEH